jgi:hydantoinase/oxoprolinase-like protein
MPDTLPEAPALRPRTDPARFEVVKNALYSAAEEMKIVLAKTAYSPLLKVAGDYSCGIFDARGNMVAQGPDLPIHLGSMPDAVRAVIAAFPVIEPDDVYIHNDPYNGGSHLPDVNVVAPAFLRDQLLGFGCVRAHCPISAVRHRAATGRSPRSMARAFDCHRCGYTGAASRMAISSASSSPTCVHPPSAKAIYGRRSPPTTAAHSGLRRWRGNTAPRNCCGSWMRCSITPSE